MTQKVPLRSEIDPKYKWNAESVFADAAAWDAEVQAILAALPDVRNFQGKLADAATLAEAFKAVEDLTARAMRIFVYANFSSAVDTTDQQAAAMVGKAQGMFGQVAAAAAFMEPELIALGEATLRQWVADEPRLAIYDHYVDDLFRQQAHVRSAEVEEVLGLLTDVGRGPYTTATMLTNADFKFPAARDDQGNEVEITQGSLAGIMAGADRSARKTAWETYMDQHLAFKNTLASNLATAVKMDVFRPPPRVGAGGFVVREQHPGRGVSQPAGSLQEELPGLAALFRHPPQGPRRGQTLSLRYVGPAHEGRSQTQLRRSR